MSTRRDRRRLVAAAHRAIARRAPSLAFATKLLDRRQRQHIWLLYAWCRAAADLVRGPDPDAGLDHLRTKTAIALDGGKSGDPTFDGLALLVAEAGIPADSPRLVVDGLAMDAT